MTEINQRIASLTPEKRALLEKRLAESRPTPKHNALIEHITSGVALPSIGQEILWALEQIDGGTPQYNVCYALHLRGEVNLTALRNALNSLVHRHETLRTQYVTNAEGQLRLEFPLIVEVPLPITDFSGITENKREESLSAAIRQEANTPIVLGKDSVIRGVIYRLDERYHVLHLTIHHAAVDGWSMGVLFGDFAAYYNAGVTGTAAQLPELAISFSDYARWQREQLAGPEGERLISYWKKQIEGNSLVLELPTDRPRPALQTFRGTVKRYAVSAPLASAIHDFCLRERVTPFMALLAGFYAVLAGHSGKRDILIGSAIAARPRVETENLVGFFTNNLLLRGNLEGNPDFRELLSQVRETALGAFAHQDLPLGRLAQEMVLERDPSRSVLFQAMLIFQNAPVPKLSLRGLETSVRDIRTDTSKFDLTIEITPSGNALNAAIEYNTDLFDGGTIDRLWDHFTTYLENAVEAPAQKAQEISLLTSAERQQLVVEWNSTERTYPRETPLAKLVEVQAKQTPNAVAVVYGDQQVTYRELNERANQLAHELRKRGAGPDQVVGLCVDRSTDMVVALLAIMKAGAAYLPMDPMLPPDRLGYMLGDSGVRLLLTEEGSCAGLPAFAGTTILLEEEGWQKNPRDNAEIVVGPEHLAYLMYTSGSTGKPKGVQVPRGALTNFLWSMREWLELNENDRMLAVTTTSFDIAGLEIWLPLLVGAQIVIASRESAADGNALRGLVEHYGITALQATPVTWRLLFDAGWRGKRDLQAVCGGESMPQEVAAQLVPVVKRVWNLYGPTETTIWSTGYCVTNGHEPILIGRPIANTQCYILDELRQPVPIGVTGELYIGGDGLARGYLNRPELTAEKFIADPFRKNGARMYPTGDLARFRADGNIECLGRLDHQVKIRGYRIELGEIEAALTEQAEIKHAVVVAREDTPGNKRLVAYLVASSGNAPEPSNVRNQLKQCLPDYMLPSAYVLLDKLPISPNGKVDRKALPPPGAVSASAQVGNGAFVPARNPTEEKIAAIFAQVLGVGKVGAHDDFFHLGGHSLTATRAVALLNSQFGTVLSVRVLFQATTVSQLAVIVDEQARPQEELWPALIPIQPHGSCAPLFCVARPNVNALGYLFLSRELGNDQPVYGLQVQLEEDPRLEFTDEQYWTTAAKYIQAMKAVQPNGPYNLVGHCQGAYIAFEMVQQLEAANEKVAFLGILDTWRDENTRRKGLFLIDQAFKWLRALDIRNVQRAFRKIILSLSRSRVSGIHTIFPADGQFADGRTLVQKYWPGRGLQSPLCNCPITVFKVKQQFWYRTNDETLGWGDRTNGGVNLIRIPGDHEKFLRAPHVGEFASLLSEALADAQHQDL